MNEDKLKELLKNVVDNAAEQTDVELQDKISSLTRLKDDEIKSIIDSGISSKDLLEVLTEVTDATKSIEEKTNALIHVNNGIKILIQLLNNFIK